MLYYYCLFSLFVIIYKASDARYPIPAIQYPMPDTVKYQSQGPEPEGGRAKAPGAEPGAGPRPGLH